jgi:hypothetical protein
MSGTRDTTDWNDLFVRTDLSETSPSSRVGGLSSPDIIPWGTQPVNPSTFTTDASYKNYVSTTGFLSGQPNYIYLRARNSSSTTDAVGEASLVLTNPAMVLWPGGDGWTTLLTDKGKKASPLKSGSGTAVAPNAIAVTEDPFVYVPSDSGHRCLVTWLSTKAHPVTQPPPKITDGQALVKFLKDNPNYAHHNLDIAPNTTGAYSFRAPLSTGTEVGDWACGFHFKNCKGFVLAFSSSQPMPNGQYLKMDPFVVQNNDDLTVLVRDLKLEQNWNIDINCTVQTNNLEPPGWGVEFVSELVVNAYNDPELMAFATPLYADFGLDMDNVRALGLRSVRVGSLGLINGETDA